MPGESSLSKLRTVCKYGSWLALIIMISSIIGLLFSVVGLTFCVDNPGDFMSPAEREDSIYLISDGILLLGTVLFICFLIYRITKRTTDIGTPFVQENVHDMKVMAVITLIFFFLKIAVNLVLDYTVGSGNLTLEIPFNMLIVSLILYFFSLLFEYGTALQTESDDFL